MRVTIQLSVHLVGSEPPRPEWFGQLVRSAMQEYLESPGIKDAERNLKEAGIESDAEIAVQRTVALQIATQLPQVQVALDVGEKMIAEMTRPPPRK